MTGCWHEQRVRERAFEIWERADRPKGKAVEKGLEQEVELEAEGMV